MKNIEIKLKYTDSGLNSIRLIVDAIQLRLDEPLDHFHVIEISREVSTSEDSDLAKLIKDNYDVSITNGWTGGCYGLRDGSGGEGLTIYFDALEVVSEYKTKDYGYVYNPAHLLKEHGTLIEGLDGDLFIEACEALGLSVKADNTYNNDNNFIFNFQLTCIENDVESSACFMVVMFHCGGDIRGNYTSKQVWKFESHDDLYSVLFPPEYEEESEAM